MRISLTVNGSAREVEAAPLARLLDVLRETLGLTGTKEGCGEGECGACTVLLDGEPVNACLVAFGQCAGRSVTTVEGLGAGGSLTPLQEAMIAHGGAQCGICTPGMLLSADALLRRLASPTEGDVREAIAGNICRCTGYQKIVDAIRAAADTKPLPPVGAAADTKPLPPVGAAADTKPLPPVGAAAGGAA